MGTNLCRNCFVHQLAEAFQPQNAQRVSGFIGAGANMPLLEFLLEMYSIHSDMLLSLCSHTAVQAAGNFAGKGTDFNAYFLPYNSFNNSFTARSNCGSSPRNRSIKVFLT